MMSLETVWSAGLLLLNAITEEDAVTFLLLISF